MSKPLPSTDWSGQKKINHPKIGDWLDTHCFFIKKRNTNKNIFGAGHSKKICRFDHEKCLQAPAPAGAVVNLERHRVHVCSGLNGSFGSGSTSCECKKVRHWYCIVIWSYVYIYIHIYIYIYITCNQLTFDISGIITYDYIWLYTYMYMYRYISLVSTISNPSMNPNLWSTESVLLNLIHVFVLHLFRHEPAGLLLAPCQDGSLTILQTLHVRWGWETCPKHIRKWSKM